LPQEEVSTKKRKRVASWGKKAVEDIHEVGTGIKFGGGGEGGRRAHSFAYPEKTERGRVGLHEKPVTLRSSFWGREGGEGNV